MMKKLLMAIIVIFFFAACENDANENENPGDTTEIKPVEDIVEVSLAEFDSLASGYIDKKVKVSGIVDHVCKKGGKKILLKSGDFTLHVLNDERYSEELNGSEVDVIGIVEENRIDEISLDEELEHAMETHNTGTDEDKEYLAKMETYVQTMKDSLKSQGVEYFSEYTLKYVSHTEKK